MLILMFTEPKKESESLENTVRWHLTQYSKEEHIFTTMKPIFPHKISVILMYSNLLSIIINGYSHYIYTSYTVKITVIL